MGEYVLEMKNITKRFAKVTANSRVNFNLKKGEVHALLGENGAGKTTLMNIIYGIYEQDEGEVFINGQLVSIKSPKDVIALGVGMVHQHFMLVETVTALENIILGIDMNLKPIKMKTIRREVQALCDHYNFNIDLDCKVRDMSVGMQQRVEIVKALYRGTDILILDEPTAVLTPQEVEDLFVILRQLVDQGKSIIIISHKLWEVMRLSQRVTVLRNGALVSTINTADTSKEGLAAMMVGKQINLDYQKTPVATDEILLAFDNISAPSHQLASTLKDLSFSIRKGEILGIAGVDGNGQLEIAEVIMGLRKITAGKLLYQGESIGEMPTRKRIENGFAHIPEDRMKSGLVMDFTVSENLVLNSYNREPYTHKAIYNAKKVKENGAALVEDYDVRPREPEALVRSFSGGNQQKIIVAREFSHEPKVILAVQPVRGLDIGATRFVHLKLMAAKCKGAAVLLITADLDEVLSVADRVLVLYEGKISGEFIPGEKDYAEIGLMMGYSASSEKEGTSA